MSKLYLVFINMAGPPRVVESMSYERHTPNWLRPVRNERALRRNSKRRYKKLKNLTERTLSQRHPRAFRTASQVRLNLWMKERQRQRERETERQRKKSMRATQTMLLNNSPYFFFVAIFFDCSNRLKKRKTTPNHNSNAGCCYFQECDE